MVRLTTRVTAKIKKSAASVVKRTALIIRKAREIRILEIVDRRRCSRREAIAEIQTRTQGYAGVAARHNTAMEASLSLSIADVVEKAMKKAMEHLAANICESLTEILTNQM